MRLQAVLIVWLAILGLATLASPKPPIARGRAAGALALPLASYRPLLTNLKGRTPILTYHDIIEKRDRKALWFDCTTAEFQSQIDWLKSRGARFVSLDEVYRHLTSGTPLPPKSIAITFADNYLGFYKRALPILRRNKIPATMFVHTDFVGSSVGRPKMSWSQLRELSQEGLITIASQTCSHPADLTKLPEDRLSREMIDSKRALQRELRKEIRYLAYPNGKFDARSEAAAKVAGYLMAMSEVTRPAEVSKSIMSINRYVHTKYRKAWSDCYGLARVPTSSSRSEP